MRFLKRCGARRTCCIGMILISIGRLRLPDPDCQMHDEADEIMSPQRPTDWGGASKEFPVQKRLAAAPQARLRAN